MPKIFTQLLALLGCSLLWALFYACGGSKPAVVDETQKNPSTSISHVNLTSNCADCHEADRKAPAVDLITVTHGLGADCSGCHAFPVFATIKAEAKLHSPPPTICMGCHDLITEKATHPPYGECAACHQFGPAWVPK